MLNLEHFDRQAEKFGHDISRITARHAEKLKHLYDNPAKQICELAHTLTEPVLYMSSNVPANVAAEVQAAYEQRFF